MGLNFKSQTLALPVGYEFGVRLPVAGRDGFEKPFFFGFLFCGLFPSAAFEGG